MYRNANGYVRTYVCIYIYVMGIGWSSDFGLRYVVDTSTTLAGNLSELTRSAAT